MRYVSSIAAVALSSLAAFLTLSPLIQADDAPPFPATPEDERPPGVHSVNWIPFNERAGFVIASRGEQGRYDGRRPNGLRGHFMVKMGAGWERLDLTPAPSVELVR